MEAKNEIDLSNSRRIVDSNTCVPIYAKTNSNGKIELAFNHQLELLVQGDELEDMLESGVIQV